MQVKYKIDKKIKKLKWSLSTLRYDVLKDVTKQDIESNWHG